MDPKKIAIIGLAAALAAGGAEFTGVAQAAYRGSEGRIAFVRDGDIYSIEPDGSGLKRLTFDRRDSAPRWSPDGKKIAYLDSGNLWFMDASGSHKKRITAAAPSSTDSRPSWSPNGRYLAFVKTARRAAYGYLTRYDSVTGNVNTFTTTFEGTLIKVPALPEAVAWAQARNAANQPGYFILYDAAGKLCRAHYNCLGALGLSHQSQVSNGYPSSEDATPAPTRLLDPDWFPIDPAFGTDALTTVESCTSISCTHTGIRLHIGDSTILPGAYQAVYSPTGTRLAFVRDASGKAYIYITINNPTGAANDATVLTPGSEPDWQPVTP